MADDHVQAAAVAAERIVAAGDAQRAVTMRQPGLVVLRVATGRHALGEADLRRITIGIGQTGERGGIADRHGVFGNQLRLGRAEGLGLGLSVLGLGIVVVRVGPLHDIVVLRTHDRQAVVIALPDQGTDIGDMLGRVTGREFDHDAPTGEFEIHRVLRIERAPIRRRRRGENVGHRHGLFRFGRLVGRQGAGQCKGKGESEGGSCSPFHGGVLRVSPDSCTGACRLGVLKPAFRGWRRGRTDAGSGKDGSRRHAGRRRGTAGGTSRPCAAGNRRNPRRYRPLS